ncbi:MAG: C-GCAxxG-C-C family protein [Chloroflexota bacterium]|nr:C-GCAxxG-C-C family protein [Chloroflexota bacterium]
MSVVDASFDQPLKPEERASMSLAGGLLQHGYQCGMLWGAALAAGAQAYGRHGPGPQAETEAVVAAQRLVESFRARNKHIDCSDLTDVAWKPSSKRQLAKSVFKFLIKGGPIGCFRMAAKYAPEAFDEINAVISEEHIEAPSPPVSCSAMLAQKMGESDMHTVMAAGFAGGIGFSGSACGALGAAIWIIGMDSSTDGDSAMGFTNPKAEETIERFLMSTDYEFECSEIVGRKFENIGEHADYLREGGCSDIIEALAAS